MRTCCCILFIFFSVNLSFAQIDFSADADPKTVNNELSRLLRSRIDSSCDFELRFWTLPSLVNYSSVFVLSKKENKWSARFFDYRGSTIKEMPVPQDKLERLWLDLYHNQVLTLPDQSLLQNRMKIYYADTSEVLHHTDTETKLMLTDGTLYTFELSTKNKKRSYSYHCPAERLKQFSNMEELYRAIALIVLIRKYLHLDLSIC